MKTIVSRCGSSLICLALVLWLLYCIGSDLKEGSFYQTSVLIVGFAALLSEFIYVLWFWALLANRQGVWSAFRLSGRQQDFDTLRQSALHYWDLETQTHTACQVLVGTMAVQVILFGLFAVLLVMQWH